MRTGVLAACLLALSGCTAMLIGGGHSEGTGLSDPRSESQVRIDRAVATAVSKRLVADPALSRYAIRVESFKSRVTLRGAVGSYGARERAVRLAGSVDGVEGVDNRIRVVEGT